MCVDDPARARGIRVLLPRRKRLKQLARNLLIIWLVSCVVLYAMQDYLLFPGRATQGQKQAIIRDPRPGDPYELVRLSTKGGEKIVAIFGRASDAHGRDLAESESRTRPTILFFYGNGMCLADTEGEYRKFRKLGMNVLIPEYVGYGMSSGKPSEHALYATAEAAYAYLLSRNDIDTTKIIPAGWSLGSAAAIEIASKHPGPGLITMSAFTSMHDMARRVLPIFPSSLMLKHHFENEQKIRAITCPILILHGKRDSIIPFSMSKRLEQAAGGPVKRICIDDADHNDLFEIGGEEMFNAVKDFVDKL
jgi:pimeloyl-ACP methyl ester carboxylesterase